MCRLSIHETSFCVSHITANSLSMCNTFGYRERYILTPKPQFWALFTHVYTKEIMLVPAHPLHIPSA